MQTPTKKSFNEEYKYGSFSGQKTAERSGNKNSAYKSPIKLEIEDDTVQSLN